MEADTPAQAIPEPATIEEIRRLLRSSGLRATDREITTLAQGYPLLKEGLQRLWGVPETRYAEPALIFHADPPLEVWPAPSPETDEQHSER